MEAERYTNDVTAYLGLYIVCVRHTDGPYKSSAIDLGDFLPGLTSSWQRGGMFRHVILLVLRRPVLYGINVSKISKMDALFVPSPNPLLIWFDFFSLWLILFFVSLWVRNFRKVDTDEFKWFTNWLDTQPDSRSIRIPLEKDSYDDQWYHRFRKRIAVAGVVDVSKRQAFCGLSAQSA